MCDSSYDADHTFGLMATTNGTFGAIQNALQSWSNGTCLSFDESKKISGPASFTTPLSLSNVTNSTITARQWEPSRSKKLFPRAECRTIQVDAGNSCATLATRCGISGADFTKYNPGSSFCATLQAKQHVCCSSGTLPDFSPKPNKDGTCFSYKVRTGDSCSAIAAANSITLKDLDTFNKDT